jgi:Haemolysin XhlA
VAHGAGGGGGSEAPGVGTGPRTGSDPTNAAQETAVLRAELRGLEAVLLERAAALDKALMLQADVHDRRLAKATEETERRIDERWTNHHREHRMIQEAVGKAEMSVDKRLEAMNELRAQINNERGSYLTRALYETNHNDLRQRVLTNSENLIKMATEVSNLREDISGMRSGQEWLVRVVAGAFITAVIGVVFTVLRVNGG